MLAVAKHLTMEWSEVLASPSLTILVKHLALPQLKQALHQRTDLNNLISV
jgi:hypothetical protein